MSLYTPVFPSFHEPSTSCKDLSENTLAGAPSKQQSYAESLRNVHLFLSTQNDVLSPPSRPNSPLFDRRVRKGREEIRGVFSATKGETSTAKWTRVSQILKLGCVRGRHWSVSNADTCAPGENTDWILPDEESEWIEWEKKREENRRLTGKTNVFQQTGGDPSTMPDTPKSNSATFSALCQLGAVARERPPRGVSPTTLRAAKEKVRKWQASVASELCHDTTSGSPSTSARVVVAATPAGRKTERTLRSRTLDFAVVKSAAKSIIGKREERALSRPAVRHGSALAPSHKSKLSEPSKTSNIHEIPSPVDADETGFKRPLKISPIKDDTPKIADVPETPYLPPSFPTHLETSTPLADPIVVVRAKPPAILPIPASSSTRPPSAPANSLEGRRLVSLKGHDTKASSSPPPQVNTVHPGKRCLGLTTPSDGISNVPFSTPPAKRLRTLSQNSKSVYQHPQSMSPNLDIIPGTRDDARNPDPDAAPSHRRDMDCLEMISGAPLAPGSNDQPVMSTDAQGFREKDPSPLKSDKSYFSAPDSDSADSSVRANLLLESPVSPMLSYAQNSNGFLPLITSTQIGKGSTTADWTNNDHNGMFGMGYSSQFDLERHVDRVSELLEKDVELDGWLQDVRMVETRRD